MLIEINTEWTKKEINSAINNENVIFFNPCASFKLLHLKIKKNEAGSMRRPHNSLVDF